MSGEGALITGAIALKSEEDVPRTGAFTLRPVYSWSESESIYSQSSHTIEHLFRQRRRSLSESGESCFQSRSSCSQNKSNWIESVKNLLPNRNTATMIIQLYKNQFFVQCHLAFSSSRSSCSSRIRINVNCSSKVI